MKTKCPHCNDYGELPNGICQCELTASASPLSGDNQPRQAADAAAPEIESWSIPPAQDFYPDPEEQEEEEPEIDWLATARLLPKNTEAPISIPARKGSRALPLLLTASRIMLYHRMIQFEGDDNEDRPKSLDDSAALLFLCCHSPRTWNCSDTEAHPLRESVSAMWAAVEQWTDTIFGTDESDKGLLRLLATRLWDHHCKNRPLPEKKTTPQTTSSHSFHQQTISMHGLSHREISSAGKACSTPFLSGNFTLPSTVTGSSAACPLPRGDAAPSKP